MINWNIFKLSLKIYNPFVLWNSYWLNQFTYNATVAQLINFTTLYCNSSKLAHALTSGYFKNHSFYWEQISREPLSITVTQNAAWWQNVLSTYTWAGQWPLMTVYIRKEHVVLPVKHFASKMTTAYRLHWAHLTIVIVINTFQVKMLFWFVCLPNKLIELNLSMQLLEHLICSSFSVWQTWPICKKYSTMFSLEWEHAKCYKKKGRREKHLRLTRCTNLSDG